MKNLTVRNKLSNNEILLDIHFLLIWERIHSSHASKRKQKKIERVKGQIQHTFFFRQRLSSSRIEAVRSNACIGWITRAWRTMTRCGATGAPPEVISLKPWWPIATWARCCRSGRDTHIDTMATFWRRHVVSVCQCWSLGQQWQARLYI